MLFLKMHTSTLMRLAALAAWRGDIFLHSN
jgi:hypothetical protein